jgi:hypothetical protein
MTLHEPRVHLVARSSEPLHSILGKALGSVGRILHWQSIPKLNLLKAGDTIVVDLLEENPTVDAASVNRLPKSLTLLLVTGDRRIDPEWIEVAVQSNARLVRWRHESPRELITEIELAAHTISGMEIAQLVTEREPAFKGLEALVVSVCEHPWEVRHPKDLALASGFRFQRIRNMCQTRGFHRVEHFIVAVRMVALEGLIGPQRVPSGIAQMLVGISDATNARRQLRRARSGSPGAFKSLALRAG